MSGKRWTKEQEEFLIENIGKLSYNTIGEKVGKTARGVRQKRIRLEIGNPKDILDYVAIKYLAKIIHASTRTINKWIKEKGLKAVKRKVATKQMITQIKLEDFWSWAKEHQELIYWNKFEKGELGIEPLWTKEARKNHKKGRITWTTEKENLLESYKKLGLTYKQIGENMNLTYGAVRARHELIVKRQKKPNLLYMILFLKYF
jgi:hypothetical protein